MKMNLLILNYLLTTDHLKTYFQILKYCDTLPGNQLGRLGVGLTTHCKKQACYENEGSSRELVPINQTTWHHVAEDCSLEDLKPHIFNQAAHTTCI
jgi:hypothetical protein